MAAAPISSPSLLYRCRQPTEGSYKFIFSWRNGLVGRLVSWRDLKFEYFTSRSSVIRSRMLIAFGHHGTKRNSNEWQLIRLAKDSLLLLPSWISSFLQFRPLSPVELSSHQSTPAVGAKTQARAGRLQSVTWRSAHLACSQLAISSSTRWAHCTNRCP